MTNEEAINMMEREKRIACFDCMHPQVVGYCEDVCKLTEAFDMAIEALHKTEWIPVSEKLPETGDSILVTYSDEEVGIVWSARPKVWGKYEKANNLIFPVAWMPLPEPWKAESEDKE